MAAHVHHLTGVSASRRSSWADVAVKAIAARTSPSERVGKSARISAIVAPSARLASTVFKVTRVPEHRLAADDVRIPDDKFLVIHGRVHCSAARSCHQTDPRLRPHVARSDLLKRRLLPSCESKGIRLLKQIDVDGLRGYVGKANCPLATTVGR